MRRTGEKDKGSRRDWEWAKEETKEGKMRRVGTVEDTSKNKPSKIQILHSWNEGNMH